MACVFDTPDRVQHMFYRYLDPALAAGKHSCAIERMYRDMDDLVGRTMEHASLDTAVFVLSDHGFCSFRRGVNLNAWLHRNGYLALKGDEIDWPRTRAYTAGLSGVYLNVRGREAQGAVDPKDAAPLTAELISRLAGLRDDDSGEIAIRNVYASMAPDLIVGYARGYRASWDAALGKAPPRCFRRQIRKPGAATIASTLHWFPACCFPIGSLMRKIPGSKTSPPRLCASSALSPRNGWKGNRSFTLLRLKGSSVAWPLLLLAGCGGNRSGAGGKQVIVIGVDGMDPGFVERHWADLPNLARMRERGSFTRLATTTPPQSPTAWSTFITGLDPADHGIFDFVHRDPATMQPFLSMTETKEGRLSDSARSLATTALTLTGRIAAQGESLLANAGRARHSRHDRPHAG